MNIYLLNKIRRDIICTIEEGMVFAFSGKSFNNELHDPDGQSIDESADEKFVPSYEKYAREHIRKQEYHTLRIGLERLNRSLALMENSWRRTDRHCTLKELENILDRQHGIEKEAENIKDVFLRVYVHTRLDGIASIRRNIAEEVRWEMESDKGSI